MLKRAMEEEAMLAKNKENKAPNTERSVPDPIESQLQSLSESMRNDKTVNTTDLPDPTIEFSFMKSSSVSSTAPLQIRNSFNKKSSVNQGVASHKRKSSGEGLFGEDLEIVEEEPDVSKRSKTDRESEKVLKIESS